MTEKVRARAIVTTPPENEAVAWKMEAVELRALGENEVLVDVVASGICHTDIFFSMVPAGTLGQSYPTVLGHEGAGYVLAVGPHVSTAAVGDPVLLSFAYCKSCQQCVGGHPAYCASFPIENLVKGEGTFHNSTHTSSGIKGLFFGQSSFSSTTIVSESSVVNMSGLVNDKDELSLFSPLGCGIQTGAGSVVNICAATPTDRVVVLGAGGVGMAAIMAAKVVGCKTIIAVDRVSSRLKLATELGATHVIDTSEGFADLAEKVRGFTEGEGASITIETTGLQGLMSIGLEATSSRGTIVLVGVPPQGTNPQLPMQSLMATGKKISGCIEGDSIPSEFIPKMIQWYRDGKFPISKIIKNYSADEFNEALAGMEDGSAIKPVLIW